MPCLQQLCSPSSPTPSPWGEGAYRSPAPGFPNAGLSGLHRCKDHPASAHRRGRGNGCSRTCRLRSARPVRSAPATRRRAPNSRTATARTMARPAGEGDEASGSCAQVWLGSVSCRIQFSPERCHPRRQSRQGIHLRTSPQARPVLCAHQIMTPPPPRPEMGAQMALRPSGVTRVGDWGA